MSTSWDGVNNISHFCAAYKPHIQWPEVFSVTYCMTGPLSNKRSNGEKCNLPLLTQTLLFLLLLWQVSHRRRRESGRFPQPVSHRWVSVQVHSDAHWFNRWCVVLFWLDCPWWTFWLHTSVSLLSVRRGQMLNVRGEKVSESMFLGALKEALSQWPGAQLVDYCCAESGIMGKTFHHTLPGFTPFLLNPINGCC